MRRTLLILEMSGNRFDCALNKIVKEHIDVLHGPRGLTEVRGVVPNRFEARRANSK